MKKINLFVDMDGVLAVYDKDVVELMYNKEFFLNRPVIKPMVELVKELYWGSRYNVYILTSVIDSPYCIQEKSLWLDTHLPEIKESNRIYVPYGTVKSEFAKESVDIENSINVLIDDYTVNLDKWTLNGALPVKVLNGINSTNGTWISSGGESIDAFSSVKENFLKLKDLISTIESEVEK